MHTETALHRIGAVSALSGVPVPTLRVWESRYGAFAPQKSEGNHRLYGDDDVLRATLLKQLTAAGHSISSLAQQDAQALSALLHQQRTTQSRHKRRDTEVQTVSLAVIGLPIARRIQSEQFTLSFNENAIRLTDILPDLDSAHARPFKVEPDILLVRVSTLHMATHAALRRLVDRHPMGRVIVLYRFAQEKIVEALKLSGIYVRREPIADEDLADLISSVVFVDPAKSIGDVQPGVMIPPRKYSDETLAKVAGISTNVLCECPKHVAELIAQLASFEQYSKECLNNSVQDAHLHAYLSTVSGTARALFERALEMLALHEGISLD